MRSMIRIGSLSGILIVHFFYYDCQVVEAENTSLAYTLSPEEVTKAREILEAKFDLEKPIERVRTNYLAISFVRLDHLKNYKADESAKADEGVKELIRKSASFIFPIQGSKKIEKFDSSNPSFAVLSPAKDEKDLFNLRITQYGPSKAFQLLFEAKQEVESKEHQMIDIPCACFIVWIPALKQYLLGDITSGRFMMKIIDYGLKDLGFVKGEFRPAHEVFEALSIEARKNNYDLPPWPFDQQR